MLTDKEIECIKQKNYTYVDSEYYIANSIAYHEKIKTINTHVVAETKKDGERCINLLDETATFDFEKNVLTREKSVHYLY